jgi:serine phosphatase RsbU (regulator of sigma subunit)
MARIEDGAKKNYFSLFPEEQIQGILDAFVINRPMAGSVGGDGFFVHQGAEDLYVAVFDCMGHGHLASMMTRQYTTTLGKIIAEENITDPGEILARLHEEFKKKFEGKKNLQVGTGADLGLVKIGFTEMGMEYAGAKMDLLRVQDRQLEVIKADRLQIGEMFEYEHSYTTQKIPIDFSNRSNFYLMSDGFKDLMGGPDNKKLGKNKMQELLEDYFKLSMKAQKTVFNNFIDEWKGTNPQYDDILIIGFGI